MLFCLFQPVIPCDAILHGIIQYAILLMLSVEKTMKLHACFLHYFAGGNVFNHVIGDDGIQFQPGESEINDCG